MFILVDNYDSFTYNLYHYIGELGVDVEVWRNDEISVEQALSKNPEALILSPGPCTPDEAGICLDLIEAAAKHSIPLFGVCLGYQGIGQVFGGRVVRAQSVMHGKTSEIFHEGKGVFKDLPSPFKATRYHSLIVEQGSVKSPLEITALTETKIVMGLRHKHLPIEGVQFHPESIESQYGHAMIDNFISMAREWNHRNSRKIA